MSYQFEQNTERICDELDASRKVRKRALEIAGQIVDGESEGFQAYGGFDAIVVSSIYASAREGRESIDSDNLEEIVRSSKKMHIPEPFTSGKIKSSYRKVCDITDTEYKPVSLENYKDLIYDELEASDKTLSFYEQISNNIDRELITRSPKSISSAAIYLASALANDSNERLNQSEVADAYNVSRTTIRQTKNDIVDQLTNTDIDTVSVNDRIFSAQLLGLEE